HPFVMETKRLWLLTILFLTQACLNHSFGQKDLDFNDVIYIELNGINGNSPEILDSVVVTIPTGRVWKIESAHTTNRDPSTQVPDISGWTFITLNYVRITPVYGFAEVSNLEMFPLWLPAGQYTFRLVRGATASTVGDLTQGFVSILEYIVTP
ncbi:MAG: hypothetical protein AAFW00_07235, partial [Bacteroidota bacterium]